jgi:hypothetical protein
MNCLPPVPCAACCRIERERQPQGPPVVLLDRLDDTVANVIIVHSRIRNVTGEAVDGLYQIGPSHDPDKLTPTQHRQSFDVVFFPELHNLVGASCLP